MLAEPAATGVPSFNLNSFSSSTESIPNYDFATPISKRDLIMHRSPTIDDTIEPPEAESTETDEGSDDVFLSSVESSPNRSAFPSIREQEVATEAPNALFFEKSTPLSQVPSSQACETTDEEIELSPTFRLFQDIKEHKLDTGVSESDKHQVPQRRASTTAISQYHAYGQNSANRARTLFRHSTGSATKMRRESIAEKLDMIKTMSRSNSVSSVDGVHRRKIDSPTLSVFRRSENSITERSRWSSDNTDTSDDDKDADPVEPALIATARRVSRTRESMFSSTQSPTCNKFPHPTLPSSPTCLSFSRGQSHPRRYDNSRRGSRISQSGTITGNGETSGGSSSRSGDLVRLVTTMQAAHLEETQRLNAIITELSSKVAVLEAQTRQQSSCAGTEYTAGSVTGSGNSQVRYDDMQEFKDWRAHQGALDKLVPRSYSMTTTGHF